MGGGGEMAAETTRKRKKKGRPSLLELQKRSLKQQLQEPLQKTPNLINPNSSINSTRRSARRLTNLNGGSPVSGGDEDDEDDRQQKKHKLLVGFSSSRSHQHYPIPSAHNSASHGSDSNADGDEPDARKFTTVKPGSDQTEEKLSKVTDTLHGSPVESGPTTPLPDKKLLVFILDRLQKKDTYGVFSEPVDPEELPDYHDIIAHPMDFSTVRKKLDGGAYTTLEQFEMDVFLICSNAMQYNAPDTIYFRQARSIQELAKKDFENLRQDSDEGEPQPKVVRRGRPPGKSLKKSLVSSSFDRVGSEHPSDATLAAGRDTSSLSNTYNLRKELTSRKLWPSDTLIRSSWGSPSKENYASCSTEWENEFPASVVKAVTKYGMKHFAVDENRRDSYNHSLTSGHEQCTFSTLDGEVKQLVPVGLSAENGYATSLARFAANLGPVVWKIASRKIESVLPAGLKFGPGWVGENRTVEQPQCSFSDVKRSSDSVSDNPPGIFLSAATSGSNSIAASKSPLGGREDTETSQNDLASAPSHQFQQRHLSHSGINGSIGGFGVGYSSQMGLMAGKADIVSHAATNVGLLRKAYNEQDLVPFAPDLNVRFLAPVSPSSSVPIGSPQHPDLALQL
ncbi:bromodomain-containing protein 1 [Hibiscus trionum]|uniref:Bromodomain-containing protein 1 n=1 Tax=Hibiscus trionum TaxID=183268 RepID=A0A9W7M7Y3_HIBTR|nr:bromodomain-containing protein 1 [Hibiscus trionum]